MQKNAEIKRKQEEKESLKKLFCMKNLYTDLEDDDADLELDNEIIKIQEIKTGMKEFMDEIDKKKMKSNQLFQRLQLGYKD